MKNGHGAGVKVGARNDRNVWVKLLVVVLACAILLISGCSGVVSATQTAAAAPALTIAPVSVSFGSVVTGLSNSQAIQLSNSGTAALTISQINVSGTGFGTSTVTLPLTLNPGGSTSFNALFAPTAPGAVTGNISMSSNAPNSPASIGLSGMGVAPTYVLSSSSSSVSFGNVTVGGNSSENVTLTNTGNSNVTISSLSVSGLGFGESGLANGTVLTPGQTATIVVTFDPAAAQSYTGTLTVTSNATGSPDNIALSGTGSTSTSGGTNPTCGTSMTITAGGVPAGGDTGAHAPPSYTSFNPPSAPGSTYTDQQFGCTVTRLTNAASNDVGSDHQLHHYYIPSALNAASNKVVIGDNQGSVIVIDTTGQVVAREGILSGYNATSAGASIYWGRLPNETNTIFWKASDGTHNVLRRADLTNCTATSPCTSSSSVTVTTVYTSSCAAGNFNGGNEDDMRWNSDTGHEYVEWDCGGVAGLLDVNTGSLGTTASLYSGNGWDADKIVRGPGTTYGASNEMYLCFGAGTVKCYDRNMNFVVEATTSEQHGNTVWDPATQTSWWVMEQSGNDSTNNPCTTSAAGSLQTGWAAMQISATPTRTCLLEYPEIPGNGGAWAAQTHVSGGDYGLAALEVYLLQGVNPYLLSPNTGTAYTLDPNYANDWGYVIGEVMLLNVSNKTVYRVCDHRSRPDSSATQDYWATPRASLSLDSNYVVFDSNMTQIGSPLANYVTSFTDVYMVGPLH